MRPLSGESPRTSPSQGRDPSALTWLDRSPVAKGLVGIAARNIGIFPGVARGAFHTGKDIIDGVAFLARLANPYDAENSPPGEAAWDEVIDGGKAVVDYTRNAIENPKMVADDVGEGFRHFQEKIDPAARPPADTFWGEAARNFNIGLNRGEAGFDAASLLVGGAQAKALAKLGKISKAAKAAKYVDRGYPEHLAQYFTETYDGMGSHFVPRRTRMPKSLGGGPIPRVILDSPFFLQKPRNMSKGDFYEHHFQVDPRYYGGPVSQEFGGGGWSGRKLGWKKHDALGRLWYGSPAPLKGVAGAGMFGAGAVVDQNWNGEGQP